MKRRKKPKSKPEPKPVQVTIYLDESDVRGERPNRFDRHHRKPRCQGGKTVGSNISLVDRRSHEKYNQLMQAVAKYFSIKVEDVKTRHIAKFVNMVLPSIQRLMVDPKSGKLKSPTQIAEEFSKIWLPVDDPLIVQFGSEKGSAKLASAFKPRQSMA